MDQAGYRFIGWNDGVVCDMGRGGSRPAIVDRGGRECFEPEELAGAQDLSALKCRQKAPRATS